MDVKTRFGLPKVGSLLQQTWYVSHASVLKVPVKRNRHVFVARREVLVAGNSLLRHDRPLDCPLQQLGVAVAKLLGVGIRDVGLKATLRI